MLTFYSFNTSIQLQIHTFTLHALTEDTLEQLFTMLANSQLLVVVDVKCVWNTETPATLAFHPRHLTFTASPRLAAQTRLCGGRKQRRTTDLHTQQLHCFVSFTLLPPTHWLH